MNFKNVGLVLTLCVSLLSLGGCIFVIAGGAGVLGGYAITRDTIQGEYDVTFSDAWEASSEVCAMLGTVSIRNSSAGVLEALVDRAKVRVEITQITPEAIRIKVKARKGIFPRIGTAEKVFVKIVQQLM